MRINQRVKHFFLCSMIAGVASLLDQNAESQTVLYNNGTPSAYNGNFNYNNTQAGNEIILGPSAPSQFITQFIVQFDIINSTPGTPLAGTPLGSEEVDLSFYANTGTMVDGYNSPALTPFYDSGFYTLASAGLTSFTLGSNLTYNVDVTVPRDFTWTLTFADVPSSESTGLALRSPPTVGNNYQDAWYNDGSGWQLQVAGGGDPALEFGAEAMTVPEPSCLWFVNLAAAAGFCWNRCVRRRPSAE